MDAIEALHARRSIGRLLPPALTEEQLDVLFMAAAAAPDHGTLRPWHFVVLDGPEKERFGDVLVEALEKRCSQTGVQPTQGQLDKERTKLQRAPTVIAAAAVNRDSASVPFGEQLASAAAAAQNMLLAATAMGLGSMWRTGPAAYDPFVVGSLGLPPESSLVGWLYFGHMPPESRVRSREVTTENLVSRWGARRP
ncbi:MAG: nitroreductase [Actinomycetota bacterium]|nr:nitroreductase [Actinomycetota bacterium]